MLGKIMRAEKYSVEPTISLEASALDLIMLRDESCLGLWFLASLLHSKNCDLDVQRRGLSFWSAARSRSSNHLHDTQSGRPNARDCERCLERKLTYRRCVGLGQKRNARGFSKMP
jgi:hypothetical protein